MDNSKTIEEDPLESVVLREEEVTSLGFKEGFQKGDLECQVIGINAALNIPRSLVLQKASLISYLEEDIKNRSISSKDHSEAETLIAFKSKLEEAETKEEVLAIIKQMCKNPHCCLQKDSFSFEYFQQGLRK